MEDGAPTPGLPEEAAAASTVPPAAGISPDDGSPPFVPPAAAKRAARKLRTALHAKDDAELVEKMATIKMADLSSGIVDNDVGAAFIAALRAAGGEAPMLVQLYMQCNTLLGPPFANAFVTIQLPVLTKLHLQGCVLGDEGTTAISTVLKDKLWPALEELNLSSCCVSDDGACALAVSIKRCVCMCGGDPRATMPRPRRPPLGCQFQEATDPILIHPSAP